MPKPTPKKPAAKAAPKLTVKPPVMKPFDGTFTPEQIELLKSRVCVGAPDDDVFMFITICERTRLDPFTRQIYLIKRSVWQNGKYEDRWTVQTAIDGFRLVAARTGEYQGQTDTLWCGPDGTWKDAWLEDFAPTACKVGVRRTGFPEPLVAAARYNAYVALKDGKPTAMWRTKGDVMIAKCAEAAALRRAFPQELGGVYVVEEMEQTEEPPQNTEAAEKKQIEGAGGKVETFAPEPEKAAKVKEVSSTTSAPAWRDYKLTGFKTDSMYFDKTLGSLPHKAIAWLRDKWTGKNNPKAKEIDEMVLLAMKELGEPAADAPAASPKPPEPSGKDETAETGQKPATGQPEGKKTPPETLKTENWRAFKVNLPASKLLHGRTLGEIVDAKQGELTLPNPPENLKKMIHDGYGIAWLRTLAIQGIPKLADDPAQVAAIKAAVKETNAFNDPIWLKILKEPELRKEVLRRFAERGMDETKADETLKDVMEGVPIAKLGEGKLRFIIQEWEKIEKCIEAEQDNLP